MSWPGRRCDGTCTAEPWAGRFLRTNCSSLLDYQGQRFDHPATSNFITVFTAAERGGDFSALLPGTQLKDPLTGQAYNRNQIPVSQRNIVATNLFASSYYPRPINGNPTNNAVNVFTQAFNTDQGDAKVDYDITPADHFDGRYSQEYQNDPSSNSLLALGNGFTHAPIHNVVGSWTHTFSPSMLNELRFGTSWITLLTGSTFDPKIGNLGTQLGIANANSVGPGLLLIGFGGGTAPEPNVGAVLTNIGNSVVDQDFADTVIQFDDGLTITRGKHVFKAGYQMWRYRINTFYSGNSGEYGSILFGGSFSGDAGADFFLGYPEATGKGVSSGGTWHQLSWTYGGYGQDDWRVTPSLTLNLGLRYQAYTPWVELNNRQDNLDLVSGHTPSAATTETSSRPVWVGRPVRGSIRWWCSRLHRRRRTLLVAAPWSRSSKVTPPRPTGQPSPAGPVPRALRSPPRLATTFGPNKLHSRSAIHPLASPPRSIPAPGSSRAAPGRTASTSGNGEGDTPARWWPWVCPRTAGVCIPRPRSTAVRRR